MMSRGRPFLLLVLAASLGLAARAEANPMSIDVVAGNHVNVSWSGIHGQDGEFTLVTSGNPSSPQTFKSFCVETNEFINIGGNYKVGSVTTTAIAGGTGGPHPDPIDSKTAYVYYSFLNGTLGSGFSTFNGSASDQDALQYLIWTYEQETPAFGISVAQQAKVNAWDAQASLNAGEGLWGVRVLNLTDDSGHTLNQDMIVYVPEPASMLLLGSGLMGLGFLRRRKRTAA